MNTINARQRLYPIYCQWSGETFYMMGLGPADAVAGFRSCKIKPPAVPVVVEGKVYQGAAS